MTTRTWNGSAAPFTTAADWAPSGVPVSGDTAIINAGTVSVGASDLAANLLLQIASGTADTEVDFNGTTILGTDALVATAGAGKVILNTVGTVTNQGVMLLNQSGAGNDFIALSDAAGGAASSFVNNGVIDARSSISLFQQVGTNAANQVVNNGLISTRAAAGQNELLFSNVPITGTGTIQVGPGYRFESPGAISAGQKIVMESSNGQGSVLAIDNLPAAQATVYGFTASDKIFLTSPQYTSAVQTTTNGVTTLTFSNGSSVVGSLKLNGSYTTANLALANAVDPNSGFEQTQITTTLADSAGTSGVSGIYRFFNTKDGTHFYTASQSEAKGLLTPGSGTYRADLSQETNGFGAVDAAAQDPTVSTIYRFFDNIHGTHFFTASAAERDTIIATRSDLNYEPTGSFLEHTTAQAGDLAIYRFVDTLDGTHFYTGSQDEFAAITKPGTAAYRADLSYEGVSFYAPSGSFTT